MKFEGAHVEVMNEGHQCREGPSTIASESSQLLGREGEEQDGLM